MYVNFRTAISDVRDILAKNGEVVRVERWQGYETGNDPSLETIEWLNCHFGVDVYAAVEGDLEANITPVEILAADIKPNLPWADLHFQERVGGVARNPDPSYIQWPWWRGQAQASMVSDGPTTHEIFTHTYSERFWPKYANDHFPPETAKVPHKGIRYWYGDLRDVFNLLAEEPLTRQAYLPIFFPEDTGAVHRGRIPCTLGYHFLIRWHKGVPKLHMWYHIRSCDFVRHFRDDLYLAARLMIWMVWELNQKWGKMDKSPLPAVFPGNLFFTAYSMHYHRGDQQHVTC